MVATLTPVAAVVTVVLESMSRTLREGAVPFQLLAGTKRSLSLVPTPRVMALESETVLMFNQVLPLDVYCQLPLGASAV